MAEVPDGSIEVDPDTLEPIDETILVPAQWKSCDLSSPTDFTGSAVDFIRGLGYIVVQSSAKVLHIRNRPDGDSNKLEICLRAAQKEMPGLKIFFQT